MPLPLFFGGFIRSCAVCGRTECRVLAHQFNAVNTAVNTGVNTEKTGVNRDRHRPGYMRMYMAVKRAVEAGRAEWLRR